MVFIIKETKITSGVFKLHEFRKHSIDLSKPRNQQNLKIILSALESILFWTEGKKQCVAEVVKQVCLFLAKAWSEGKTFTSVSILLF